MKQFDVDVMWLEAMEEIDEVEADFWETLEGKNGSTETTTREDDTQTAEVHAAPDYS